MGAVNMRVSRVCGAAASSPAMHQPSVIRLTVKTIPTGAERSPVVSVRLAVTFCAGPSARTSTTVASATVRALLKSPFAPVEVLSNTPCSDGHRCCLPAARSLAVIAAR